MHENVLKRLDSLDAMLPELARAADEQESNPSAWRRIWAEPRMRAISYVGVPDAINPYPFHTAGLGPDCGHALHLALVERLSRGAASTMMALPASALSTRAVLRLGTPDQITRFFAPFGTGEAWTFFAVTEPQAGSDASNAQTVLQRDGDGYVLTGRKTLVGGATLASCGLVLALDPEARQLRLVMVNKPAGSDGFTAAKLSMTGLKGAGISELQFDRYPVSADNILAHDSRRPVMMTLGDVFEKHRPLVGAMALGTTRAMLSRLADCGFKTGFEDIALNHRVLCDRMIRLGEAADNGPIAIHDVSQFKLQACQLADCIRARTAEKAPDLILQDPRSRRLWRDAGAFEYMEGTSNIHRLNAYRAFLTGDPAHELAV